MIKRPDCIPPAFWLSMYATHQKLVADVCDDGYCPLPSGSRWICPMAAAKDADWDLFFVADDKYIEALLGRGFVRRRPTEPQSYPQIEDENDGACLYQDGLNLVVIKREFVAKYDAFKAATDFCKTLGGPSTRESRVEIFEAFKTTATLHDALAKLPIRADCLSLLQAVIAADMPEWAYQIEAYPGVVADALEDACDPRCEYLRELAGVAA
jgi:hypothetical protein